MSLSALEQMLATLPEAPAAPAVEAFDRDSVRAVLAQLEPLLARFDTASADLFDTHRAGLLAALGADGQTLARQLANFDYPAALETVKNARLTKGQVAS